MRIKDVTIPVGLYSIAATLLEPTSYRSEPLLWLMGVYSSRTDEMGSVVKISSKSSRPLLVIDYSGHGDSPYNISETTPLQHINESHTAALWLQYAYNAQSVALSGGSYGGYLAASICTKICCQRLILRAPAMYPQSWIRKNWHFIESRRPQLQQFRADERILKKEPFFSSLHSYTGKTLLLEHEYDEFIPRELIANYMSAIIALDYHLIPGVSHSLSTATEEQQRSYEQTIIQWLNSS